MSEANVLSIADFRARHFAKNAAFFAGREVSLEEAQALYPSEVNSTGDLCGALKVDMRFPLFPEARTPLRFAVLLALYGDDLHAPLYPDTVLRCAN